MWKAVFGSKKSYENSSVNVITLAKNSVLNISSDFKDMNMSTTSTIHDIGRRLRYDY